MRFITEFENTYEAYGDPAFDRMHNAYKGKGALDIGNEIANSFGWKVDEQRFKVHTSLEIEAFPMDKWIEFKKRFSDALPDYDAVSRSRLIGALTDLESFIKPAGEQA
jgi:hypothetical protein